MFQTCDMKLEGKKRYLTLKNVQLDQAGEVSYQALNAVTTAMLTVKGTVVTHTMTQARTITRGTWQHMVSRVFVSVNNRPRRSHLAELELNFEDPLKDVSVPEKKQAKFECTITKEVSKVMWFRGAEIVTPGPKYEIIQDGCKHMLVINSCEFDDESQYSVEISDKKSSAILSVEGKCRQ